MLEVKANHGAKSYELLFDIRDVNPILTEQVLTLCKVTIEQGHRSTMLEVDKEGKMKAPDQETTKDLLSVLSKCGIKTTAKEDISIIIVSSTKYCQIDKTYLAERSDDECNIPNHSTLQYKNIPCPHDGALSQMAIGFTDTAEMEHITQLLAERGVSYSVGFAE